MTNPRRWTALHLARIREGYLSQGALADAAKVHVTAINKIETGERPPSAELLAKLQALLPGLEAPAAPDTTSEPVDA